MSNKPSYEELEQRIKALEQESEEKYRLFVTGQKKIEENLESQNRLMSTILNNIQVGVFMVEAASGRPLLANKRAMELLGRGIMNGADQSTLAEEYQAYKAGTDALYPRDEMPIVRGLKGESHSVDDMIVFQPDGKKVHLQVFGSPVKDKTGKVTASIASFSDITDLKEYKQQLQQAQKLEAIGTLAGGVAHDFNNILSIILGNTELALDDVPEWNPARENLDEVVKASLRAKDVIRQLLSFSRKSNISQKPVAIAPIIRESLKLMRSSLPTTIDIQMNLSEKNNTVLADPTQIHQIIINLCTNAAHAMSTNGGILKIDLSDVVLDENGAMPYADIHAGHYVCISVRDTGHGIPLEIRERIFDPYFTTKEFGKGTGMGLAVVHGIVKNHNGTVAVFSEPGRGTTFEVLLPAVDIPPESQDENYVHPPTGSEKILFIDDEPALVHMCKQMLEKLGYEVTAETSPLKALDVFSAQPDAFDLIITDMTMPKMTGDQLTKEILKIRPNMPIILCTGYSEKLSRNDAAHIGIKKYIEKPINKYDLSVVVREVLDDK